VVEVESGTTFHEEDDGRVRFSHEGRVWYHTPDPICHTDNIVERYAALRSRKRVAFPDNGWIDYAGWYPPAPENSLAFFNGTYTIPGNPADTNGPEVLFYFIGMQDNDNRSVNILQPVLTWGNGIPGWNAASWACCPKNITVQSKSITGFKAGDQLYGYIQRVNSDTWTIVTQVATGSAAGEITTLNAQVGTYIYNWADVTLEVYNVNSCNDYAPGPMTFSGLTIIDSLNADITAGAVWTLTPGTDCGGFIKQTGFNSFVVQQTQAGG